MKVKLIPAAGYIRMSTDKQEDSPEQQRAEILKLAKREGYDIIRWYEDHGISGAKTHKRKQFIKMIRDAQEKGDFQAILCWDQDRFGRFDSIEAGEWIGLLRRAKVQLVTVVQGHINWDDFAGRMIYQITQEGKHRFLVDLSKNVLRGMIRHAKEGHALGAPTPYGYDRQYFDANGNPVCLIRRRQRFHKPKEWRVKFVPSSDPVEVETVRWIFRTFAKKDITLRSMARDLNHRAIPAPVAKEWSFDFVRKILRNPVYLGWISYGRRGAGLYHNVGLDGEITAAHGRREPKSEYAPIIAKDCHEPLVDEQLFRRVQDKLAKIPRGLTPQRKRLLSGLLRCGHCGALLTGSRGSRGHNISGKPYDYYKCNRNKLSGSCKSYMARTEVIENALIDLFRKMWLSDSGYKLLQKAVQSVAKECSRQEPNKLASLRTQLAKLERQISQGTKNLLLADSKDVPMAAKMLAELREHRDHLQEEIDSLAVPTHETKDLDIDAVICKLEGLEEELTSDSLPLARTAFRQCFKSVTLFWEQVSPRRRELVRAVVEPLFPICVLANTQKHYASSTFLHLTRPPLQMQD
jgi:site-specific DNA recombinase